MPEFLVICGSTAVGKSSTGVLLAEALDGEIISADSMQLYRRLDIGTDKPLAELRTRVPHHMIDLAEPGDAYSAATYEREASVVIERLQANDKLPIVVGGSGLYIRVLINGIFPAPPTSASIRRRLKREADEKGLQALHDRLTAVDPAYARTAAPTDLRRIARSLEVFELTGTPFSEWHDRHRSERRPRDALMLGLRRSKEDLYRRIDRRVDEMFAAGLVDEVRKLCEQGHLDALRHLRPLGYVEVMDYLEGRSDLQEAVSLTKRNSRRYAKRQMTWFRKENVRWVDLAGNEEAAAAVNKILPLLPGSLRERL